jgi:murein DD-endopeptidase MepM/ murein hydrolase activator NlpD
MGRLLLFVLGIAIGAAGMYMLVQKGVLEAPAPMPVQVVPAAGSEAPAPTIEDLRPPLPSTRAPLPPPLPEPVDELTAQATDAATPSPANPNASEQTGATTPEAAAAITAATAAASDGRLLLPVQGVQASQLTDTFTQSRGEGRLHDAIDIMAARGTPVLAVADGRVAKLFDSKAGGLTVYQFDREEKLAYYYAHLDHYAAGLAEGRQLKRGDVLGYVGSTGNASPDGPHLHFAVFVLGPEKNWWKGTAVNPYPLLGGK